MIKIFLIIGVAIIVTASVVSYKIQEAPEILQDLDLCKAEPVCYTARVTRIIDGDTIDVAHLTTGEAIRIRLALVDTAERGEELYDAARDFTGTMCPAGSRIIFDQDDGQLAGSYGRVIGAVYCNGVLLNEALLDTSLAVLDTRFCEASEYGTEWAIKYGC